MYHLAHPRAGGSLLELVEGLEGVTAFIKYLDGNFEHSAVFHAALEVLFGQGLGEVHRGAVLVLAVQHITHELTVEHQIAMQEDHVVVDVVAGKEHGVDIVGLVVEVVTHEGELGVGEQGGRGAYLLFEGADSDDEFAYAFFGQQAELTVQYAFAVLEGSHALMEGFCEIAHTVAEAGIEDDGFHGMFLYQWAAFWLALRVPSMAMRPQKAAMDMNTMFQPPASSRKP